MVRVTGIEVEGVGYIVVSGDGVLGYHIYVLVPMGTSNNDYILGVVFSDLIDNGNGIFFDGLPRLPLRFVPYFVYDIGYTYISFCHLAEESLSLFDVPVGVVVVPVYDYINTALNPTVGDLLDQSRLLFGLLKIPFIRFDGHGKPDE